MIHEGVPADARMEYHESCLLGIQFLIALVKRILLWEDVRQWTEADECKVPGLQALARYGQTSVVDGHAAYERAIRVCRDEQVRQHVAEHLERLMREKGADK